MPDFYFIITSYLLEESKNLQRIVGGWTWGQLPASHPQNLHGCFFIQIDDQGREFVNSVFAELYRLTGVIHRVTSAYHPKASGLIERGNRTIKNLLIKALDSSLTDWSYVLIASLKNQKGNVLKKLLILITHYGRRKGC